MKPNKTWFGINQKENCMLNHILLNACITFNNLWKQYTQRYLFEILLNQTEIRFYLPFSD